MSNITEVAFVLVAPMIDILPLEDKGVTTTRNLCPLASVVLLILMVLPARQLQHPLPSTNTREVGYNSRVAVDLFKDAKNASLEECTPRDADNSLRCVFRRSADPVDTARQESTWHLTTFEHAKENNHVSIKDRALLPEKSLDVPCMPVRMSERQDLELD